MPQRVPPPNYVCYRCGQKGKYTVCIRLIEKSNFIVQVIISINALPTAIRNMTNTLESSAPQVSHVVF